MRKLRKGEQLEGRYRVQALIASGGQAHVYRGLHEVLDRAVAIKLLKTHGSLEVRERMAKRFEQEAKLISKLRDPHTITLYDFGKLEDGALFMVFEYIDGISLKELVAKQGNVEPYRVAKILKQTLSSLHEAHSMGILHRDLKPANIMIYEHAGRKDLVKLLDFGIAKILREQSAEAMEQLTGNNLVGTPRYIAPEVYQSSENLGPRSDLYSLGLVAYELLVGEPAIKGDTAIAVFRQQFNTHSIKLPEHVEIPQGLRQIIDKMIERAPSARYATSEHVLWDLRGWQQSSFVASLQGAHSSGEFLAFDPQDLIIPDPYDDVAPTQNISGQVLANIRFDSPDLQDMEVNDTMTDASDSAEYLRRVNPDPTTRHTPSHGLTRSPVALYKADHTVDDFEVEPPTQVSQILTSPEMINPADSRTEVIPGIISADLFLQDANLPDFGQPAAISAPESEYEDDGEDHTSEIQLTDELKQDIERARARQIHTKISDHEDDDTEAIKKLPSVARHPMRPRRRPSQTGRQDD